MASQSPAEQKDLPSYRNAWSAISRAMENGDSWSGRERNRVWLNRGSGKFADASGVSGLDFEQDGRSVLAVDWDSDGDEDLWLRSRTSPGLRFLENQARQGAKPTTTVPIILQLQRKATGKDAESWAADAFGAQVEITTGEHSSLRGLLAGEGYLAQSDSRIVFALPPSHEERAVMIRWPDGMETKWQGILDAGIFRMRQGDAAPIRTSDLGSQSNLHPGALVRSTPAPSIVLRQPLPLPEKWRGLAGGNGGLVLFDGLRFLGGQNPGPFEFLARAVRDPDLKVTSLSLGQAPQTRQNHHPVTDWIDGNDAKFWETLARYGVAGMDRSQDDEQGKAIIWILDAQGSIQATTRGRVDEKEVRSLLDRFVSQRVKGAERGLFPGRWFHGGTRNTSALALELEKQGLSKWAATYKRPVRPPGKPR